MFNILVLGDTLFVCDALVKHLINKGHEVDLLTSENITLNYMGYRTHIICNRRSKEDLRKVLKNKHYDIVFDISAYNKDDIEILFNCLDSKSLKKYIFFSSAAVYIPSKEITFENSPKGENSILGEYGLNKLNAEEYINDLINNNSVKAIIFRTSYIYGKGNNLYRENYFFDKIMNNEIIYIPNNDVKIQFIHIDDLVKICECALYNDNLNRAYNVTSPNQISWRELVETCGNILKIKPTIKEVDINSPLLRDFPFKNVDLNLNITDLRENGFHLPVIYLDQGLKLTFNSDLKNKKTNGLG